MTAGVVSQPDKYCRIQPYSLFIGIACRKKFLAGVRRLGVGVGWSIHIHCLVVDKSIVSNYATMCFFLLLLFL